MVLRRYCALDCSAALLICALALIVQDGSAQQKDTTAVPAAALPAVIVSGFVDTYFDHNFASPKTRVNELRNFDVSEDQFILSMAEVSVQRAASPVGFRVDIDLGQGNDIVQSGATGSLANLRQAYVTVVAPVGSGVTIDVGKFVTHCCYEVIPAKDNFNYSRSLLFAWSVPYYHIGARASYAPSAALTLNGYIYNGWNGTEVNPGKTFGFEGVYAPASSLSFTLNWLGGPALPDTVSNKYRNIYEIIATYQATEKLTLALNGVYGEDHPYLLTALWRGVAAYAKYALNDVSAFAVRAEVFSDPQGFMTSAPQSLYETTLTYEFRPFQNLILRSEYRYDWSTVASFDGDTSPHSRRNQSTLGMGAIVTF
ncbi:MAG TPA: porin [Bacteroidota bacterium]|nr:porin [Bacteroidota bacterium]